MRQLTQEVAANVSVSRWNYVLIENREEYERRKTAA